MWGHVPWPGCRDRALRGAQSVCLLLQGLGGAVAGGPCTDGVATCRSRTGVLREHTEAQAPGSPARHSHSCVLVGTGRRHLRTEATDWLLTVLEAGSPRSGFQPSGAWTGLCSWLADGTFSRSPPGPSCACAGCWGPAAAGEPPGASAYADADAVSSALPATSPHANYSFEARLQMQLHWGPGLPSTGGFVLRGAGSTSNESTAARKCGFCVLN